MSKEETAQPFEGRSSENDLSRLFALQLEEGVLIKLMQRQTHSLVREAFVWKYQQNLNWLKGWEEWQRGPKNWDSVSYYFFVEDDGRPIILEAFEPYIPEPSRSRDKPEYLCLCEYETLSEKPLAFEREKVVGSNLFGKNILGIDKKRVPENLDEALVTSALGIAAYTRRSPFSHDERGRLHIGLNCYSFGWNLSETSQHSSLSTSIPLSPVVVGNPSRGSAEIGFFTPDVQETVDPFNTARRRFNLLLKAQLVGISEPPERIVKPYSKS